jgi:hypothetical protein
MRSPTPLSNAIRQVHMFYNRKTSCQLASYAILSLFILTVVVRLITGRQSYGDEDSTPFSRFVYNQKAPLATNAKKQAIHIAPIADACVDVVRMGTPLPHDGGWNICRDNLQPGYKVYSVGIGRNPSFDIDIAADGGEIWCFDHTIRKKTGSNIAGPMAHFYSVGLTGAKDGVSKTFWPDDPQEEKTLESIMAMMKHTRIDILKVDIEGNEWEVFQAWFDHRLIGPGICPPFKTLLMELHFWSEIGKSQGKSQFDADVKQVQYLIDLEKAGFKVYDSVENWRNGDHRSIAGSQPMYDCVEVAWVHDGSGCK